ncbi:MAG: bifunctional diaminohydroxyphosphoribosylaminopyrimidine deaminase/5-amino-6-(5-phosphoribosylamino)uracil reductase RibD, partial [Gemmatimonadota bacterium]
MVTGEREAMRRAVALAWHGWGRVHPNPLVGAVVLREGREVGAGWHAEFGGPHAEAVALGAAGASTRGATLVVSLEPCRHQGKQPPCTDAILAAGVTRVVIGQPDPHPDAGGGGALLESHGVEVTTVDSPEARYQNAPFLHSVSNQVRPFVALKLATSIDSRLADAQGQSRWVSGPEAREFVHWLRTGFDAIGVGGETARADHPSLTVRGSITPRIPPRRIVFSRSSRIEGADDLLRATPDVPVLLVLTGGAGELVLDPPPGITVLPAVDLADGLKGLRAQGVRSLLVEGGGRLATALLTAGLVNRFYWV